MPTSPPRRSAAAVVAVLLLGAAAAGAAPAPPQPAAAPREAAPALAFERATDFPALGDAHAVALDAASGSLAAGDDAGAWLKRPGEPARRVLRRGPVRDLLFAAAGLWVATDRGLFLRDAEGRVADRSPGPGALARTVRRLVAGEGFLVAGTAAGAFHSADGRSWTRLDAGLPDGEIAALALRRADGAEPDAELWLVADDALVRARLAQPRARARVVDVDRVALPEGGRGFVDLLAGAPDADLLALSRDALHALQAGRWTTWRPALPPGAEPRRLGAAAGRLWIATDRGLLAGGEEGFERAADPAGTTAAEAVAGDAHRVVVAGARGLLLGAARLAPAAGARPPAPDLAAGEPDVRAVHAAALRYLDLEPQRVRSLWRGVRRRGWLPRVEIAGGYGGGRDRSFDWDEAFTGGETRLLFDRGEARERDFDVAASLEWDLGEIVYHPDSVDVSREARELVELRDEVLDEITQLYFERRRALLDLAAAAPGEAARLRVRADELAAGLDAWTGGWWSRRVVPLASPSPPGPAEENTP
jgi:hypothetical protein